ncbi:MAG TPA: hypothetical protein VI168_07615, partial [Croceibacterium sp.]
MELLTSLPPDLAAFAAPAVRGPAPLLRPPDGGAVPAAGATAFELCLALLTGGPAAGDSWPATGKELPAVPLESAAGPAAAELDPALLLAFAPGALADMASQPRLPSGEAPAPVPSSNSPVPPPLPPATSAHALPPLPSAAADAATDTGAPQTGALDPLAALMSVDTTALPLEGGEPQS